MSKRRTTVDSIAQMAERLDAWLDRNLASFESDDVTAQAQALRSGFEIVKELDRLRDEGLAAITTVLRRSEAQDKEERVRSLLQTFAFAAKLSDTLHDELLDTKSETRISHLMDSMVVSLEKLNPGRKALTAFLDDPDVSVRAAAGRYLIDLMPKRVVPMLREIDEEERGSSAGFNAMWILVHWEREKGCRFEYLKEKYLTKK